MKFFKLQLLSVFFLLLTGNAFSQNPSSGITINVDSVYWDEVAAILSRQTDKQLYYKLSDFDTSKFSINKSSVSINEILDLLFVDTDFNYIMYGDNFIFITKGKTIQTQLPINFFKTEVFEKEIETDLVPEFMQTISRNSVSKDIETKLINIGKPNGQGLNGRANIAGYVKDIDTGEPVVGAVVFIEEPRIGVATDQFGYYSISLPKGRHELKVASIGMKDTKRQIMLHSDGKLEIEIKEDIIPLREIIVESERDVNVNSLNMGVEKLDIKTLKQVPTAFGETDILKVALTLPGVQSVGESSTGLNVRGGATDQNLILYNDAVIYNPSHLFGFFSAFNPDVLKSVEIFKSGIPANYGGRLSSVLEIATKDGNKKKFTGSGGIGSLTTRLAFEVPIIKDKLSVSVAGRTTYSDWMLKYVPDEAIKNSQASFYDLNAHINYDIDEKNSIYLTGYYSNDRFKLNSDTVYQYNNKALTFKWKHIFQNKFYGIFTSSYSAYDYNVNSDINPVNAFEMKYNLNQLNGKLDFYYFPNSSHNIDFGVSSNYYEMYPGDLSPDSPESLIIPVHIPEEKGVESAVYLGDKFEISSRLSIYAGLRYSIYSALGSRDIYTYADGLPKEVYTITDTVQYGSGVINTYSGPEFRASLRYLLGNDASLKVSYNKMRQYIHMLSNTTAISPTDTWKLSDPNIKPQIGDQYSIGLYKNIRASAIETSLEAYYKESVNTLDFKGGAELILNENIETDVIPTEGMAYGIEFLIKKMKGKINGWVSYTYSRSFLRTNSDFLSETINNGDYYPSNYDKPHDFTLIGNYKFNRRVNIGLNITYSTGRPITLPLTKYELGGTGRVHYSDRNKYRVPDYFRMDLSMNIEGNHKVNKLAHSSWTIAVYNLTGRNNAYSVYFVTQDGKINGYQLSIYGNLIPTITYNFSF